MPPKALPAGSALMGHVPVASAVPGFQTSAAWSTSVLLAVAEKNLSDFSGHALQAKSSLALSGSGPMTRSSAVMLFPWHLLFLVLLRCKIIFASTV